MLPDAKRAEVLDGLCDRLMPTASAVREAVHHGDAATSHRILGHLSVLELRALVVVLASGRDQTT
jgi:hypothetical protein